jgi:hypothetical protein
LSARPSTHRRAGGAVLAALLLAAGACRPEDMTPPPDGEAATTAVPATRGPTRQEATEGVTPAPATATEPDVAARSGEPRPGDMLTAGEERAATDLALEAASGMLAAATNRDALGATADLEALADQPSYRVMYAQRYVAKEDGGARAAEVAFYRYDTNEVVLSRVDLASRSVEQLPAPPGYVAPLLPEEIAEAARVARGDPAVAAQMASSGLDPEASVANGILTTASGTGEACASSRCVRLYFFDPDHVVPDFTVIVDLSRLKVVEVEPMSTPLPPEEPTP